MPDTGNSDNSIGQYSGLFASERSERPATEISVIARDGNFGSDSRCYCQKQWERAERPKGAERAGPV